MHAITNNLLKVPTALFAAVLVTTMLFYMMQLMVHSNEDRVQETYIIPIIDARMPDIEPVVIENIERPEPIVEPPVTDVLEDTRQIDIGTGPLITLNEQQFNLNPPGWKNLTFQNSEMIPIVRTTPVYPTRALQRQVEGFVVVSFTVDRNGNVADPSVIYAEPDGYFERAALQSIAKWKYTAKVENGEPVPVHGVQQRIVFEITK